jgi:uncharacterized protein
MIDPDLVAALSTAQYLPVAEIQRAIAEPDLILDAVLDVLNRAADGEELDDAAADLLFWGIHALGGARETRLYRPLLALMRQDGEVVEGILGDGVSETLARIFNSVFDGDAMPLVALLLDSTVDDVLRNELFATLTFLTQTGQIPRQDTHDLLVRFDDKRVAVENESGWLGWEETIALLGFHDLVPRVEVARGDGRLAPEVSDPTWFRKLLREADDRPDDLTRFDPLRHDTLNDPIAALAWTAEDYGQPVRNPYKSVGRNDPCPCGSGKKFKKCCLSTLAA